MRCRCWTYQLWDDEKERGIVPSSDRMNEVHVFRSPRLFVLPSLQLWTDYFYYKWGAMSVYGSIRSFVVVYRLRFFESIGCGRAGQHGADTGRSMVRWCRGRVTLYDCTGGERRSESTAISACMYIGAEWLPQLRIHVEGKATEGTCNCHSRMECVELGR